MAAGRLRNIQIAPNLSYVLRVQVLPDSRRHELDVPISQVQLVALLNTHAVLVADGAGQS